MYIGFVFVVPRCGCVIIPMLRSQISLSFYSLVFVCNALPTENSIGPSWGMASQFFDLVWRHHLWYRETTMADPFRSERLIYRAPDQEGDVDFFHSMETDPIAFQMANTSIKKPQSKDDAKKFLKIVAEETLLGVVICLPAHDAQSKPIPIGVVNLDQAKPEDAHHRHADIGVNIVKPYQNQGYGSEAIRWALNWAFKAAGLHRVGIAAFSYNEGAIRLYERLGFKREGVVREYFWHDGRWWDDVQFGMLASEWDQRNA